MTAAVSHIVSVMEYLLHTVEKDANDNHRFITATGKSAGSTSKREIKWTKKYIIRSPRKSEDNAMLS